MRQDEKKSEIAKFEIDDIWHPKWGRNHRMKILIIGIVAIIGALLLKGLCDRISNPQISVGESPGPRARFTREYNLNVIAEV